MNAIHIKILIMLFTIGTTSCYKELIIDVENETDKIVMNGLVNNMDTLSVTITSSFATDGIVQIDELKNASVSVFENDIYIEDLVYNKNANDPVGRFSAGFIPKINQEYKITINDPVLGEAIAYTKIPKPVEVSEYEAKLVRWGGDYNFPRRYRYSFKINDPETKNYYFIRFYMKIYLKEKGIESNEELTYMYGDVLSGSIPDQEKYVYGGLLFSDDGFNGTNFTITGSATLQDTSFICNAVDYWMLDMEEYEIGCSEFGNYVVMDINKLYLHLEVLSEETYLFYKSHAKIIRNVKDPSDLRYKEHGPVFSNVDNGYGIFGGLSKEIQYVTLNGYDDVEE